MDGEHIEPVEQVLPELLSAYRKTSEQRARQERLVEALRDATRVSTERYQSGIDSYLSVLDSQRNLFQGELDLARLRQQERASIVQLYRASGGGWSPQCASAEAAAGPRRPASAKAPAVRQSSSEGGSSKSEGGRECRPSGKEATIEIEVDMLWSRNPVIGHPSNIQRSASCLA